MATAKVSLSPYQQFPKTQRIIVNNKFLLSKLVYFFGHPKPFLLYNWAVLPSHVCLLCHAGRAMLTTTLLYIAQWAMACCACAPSLNHSFSSLPCNSRQPKPPHLGVRRNNIPMMKGLRNPMGLVGPLDSSIIAIQ